MRTWWRLPVLVAACAVLAGCGTTAHFPNAFIGGSVWPTRQMSAVLARPDGPGPFPAVVLLHSCAGFRPHVSVDWPRFLAANGYVALSVDSFGSRGLSSCPNALVTGERKPMHDTYRELGRDAFGGLDYLATLPFVDRDRVAVIGFSLGANTINGFIAHVPPTQRPQFAAAVGLYGRCQELLGMPDAKIPLLELAGDKDPQHVESCSAVAHRYPVQVLPDAHHAWDDPSSSGRTGTFGEIMSYSPAATARSRELVLDFLGRHLKPGKGT